MLHDQPLKRSEIIAASLGWELGHCGSWNEEEVKASVVGLLGEAYSIYVLAPSLGLEGARLS